MPDNTQPNIERPRLCRLALQVEAGALRAVVWSTVEDSSLRNFSLPLDPTLAPAKALEEAVYAAPVLLSDFAGVDIVMRTGAYTLVPADTDADTALAVADYCRLTSDADGTPARSEVRTDSADDFGSKLVWTLPADLAHFLARTFRNPRMHCHMAPLLRYFGRKNLLGNTGKVYAHFHGNGTAREVDIVAVGADGRLAAAVTHPCPADNDALYYIMATLRYAGLDPVTDEILVCGDPAARDAIMPLLRRYAAYVMPVIFPSAALRSGREAFNAPFPLVILPLCE